MSRNPKRNKEVGNTFERKIAKDLSLWIFNDDSVLRRHPTSGADKKQYSGDIFPMKQISWKEFIIHIEAKDGYNKNSHPLAMKKQIELWYLNAIPKLNKEKIIWIIWKIPHKGILFCSDIKLEKIKCELINPIICSDNTEKLIYIYNYKNILSETFEKLIDINYICEGEDKCK